MYVYKNKTGKWMIYPNLIKDTDLVFIQFIDRIEFDINNVHCNALFVDSKLYIE